VGELGVRQKFEMLSMEWLCLTNALGEGWRENSQSMVGSDRVGNEEGDTDSFVEEGTGVGDSRFTVNGGCLGAIKKGITSREERKDTPRNRGFGKN